MAQTNFTTCALLDPVLCLQVLEHVWQHRNLLDLMRTPCGQKRSYGCLCLQIIGHGHGSFHDPGAFTPQLLALNLKDKGFKILNIGSIG